MPIKETCTFIRKDYNYDSPDGEEYLITYMETTDRKYVEIRRKDTEEKVTFDLAMLCDIVDCLRPTPKTSKTGLRKPNITDRRGGSEHIQSAVDESMSKLDDSASASESLVKASHNVRTGLAMSSLHEDVPRTPDEWSVVENDAPWKEDVKKRQEDKKTGSAKEKGSTGKGFQRGGISAEELI